MEQQPANYDQIQQKLQFIESKLSALTKIENELTERENELKCLYSFTKMEENSKLKLADSLNEAVHIIYDAIRQQSDCGVSLVYGKKDNLSHRFEKVLPIFTAPIRISGRKVGSLNVYYISITDAQKEILSTEKKNFLTESAVRISSIIQKKKSKL
jgi:hypothetical protein